MATFTGRVDLHIIGGYLKPLAYGTWHLRAVQDGRCEAIREKWGDVSSFMLNTPEQAELRALDAAMGKLSGTPPLRLFTTSPAIADFFDTLETEFADGLTIAMAERIIADHDLGRFSNRLAFVRGHGEMRHIIEMLQGESK